MNDPIITFFFFLFQFLCFGFKATVYRASAAATTDCRAVCNSFPQLLFARIYDPYACTPKIDGVYTYVDITLYFVFLRCAMHILSSGGVILPSYTVM